jgi:DNA-binding protein H-NS
MRIAHHWHHSFSHQQPNEDEMTDNPNTPTLFEINQLRASAEAELERLNQLAQEARERERGNALLMAQSYVDTYGFTRTDLTLAKTTSASKKPATAGPKKYRHPGTGAEWSGKGMAPEWIISLDKAQFVNPVWSAKKKNKSEK